MEGTNKRMRLVRCTQQSQDLPELKRRRLIHIKQLHDVPELIQQIQSLLPANQAARTSAVSEPWLHALSTTPALRFQPVKSLNKQEERNYIRLINQTLQRYQRENIPIVACDLHFGIHKQKSASRAEKWIKHVTSKTCLKELSLAIKLRFASFTLPDEIFSSEKLNTLSIILDESMDYSLQMMSNRKFKHAVRMKNVSLRKNYSLFISGSSLIECVNLRVLELLNVHISEEVLRNLLSTCKLLEKINLKLPEGLEKIKVNNLRYLQELQEAPGNRNDILEIHDVQSLRSFLYDASSIIHPPVISNMDVVGSLRELQLDRVIMTHAFSDMINSKFPLLESLTLDIISCRLDILDFNCVALRRFKIQLMATRQTKVQLYAPVLLIFRYECINFLVSCFQPAPLSRLS